MLFLEQYNFPMVKFDRYFQITKSDSDVCKRVVVLRVVLTLNKCLYYLIDNIKHSLAAISPGLFTSILCGQFLNNGRLASWVATRAVPKQHPS